MSDILKCVSCGKGSLTGTDSSFLQCNSCKCSYPVQNGVAVLIDKNSMSGDRKQVSAWWDDLCTQWYSGLDKELTTERLYNALTELEELYEKMNHLVLYVDVKNISGKKVLDIGSGGGAQDALFKRYGAHVYTADISLQRAFSTGHKLSMVPEGFSFSAQADGEKLPFQDNSFDIVYSNGVMHHSESTEAMIDEAFRVLKPGGKFVTMLYSKFSMQYFALILYYGLLRGYYFRYGPKYWLGACTEGRPKFGEARNPFTRAYTKNGIFRLLHKFENVSPVKNEFHLYSIPYFGRRFRRFWCRLKNEKLYKDSLVLIEGRQDFGAYLPIEKKLSPYIGWFWNITATKPKI